MGAQQSSATIAPAAARVGLSSVLVDGSTEPSANAGKASCPDVYKDTVTEEGVASQRNNIYVLRRVLFLPDCEDKMLLTERV